MSNLALFTGNANPQLAQKIAKQLRVCLGDINVSQFSDGETHVKINKNVRGKDIFVIQSTCPPTNTTLMELLLMVDAFRRASAKRITAVVPYYGYARQDRRPRSERVPISARVVADLLGTVGVDRVLTVDLHCDQIQGFFSVPVDNLYGTYCFVDHMKQMYFDNPMVVSPDTGGIVRSRWVAKQLGCGLGIIDKRREQANQSDVMNIIGDVEGKECILVDDLIDTAGTLCKAANALVENGAKRVYAYCTHPVLSGKAFKNIEESKLDKLVITDTIPLPDKMSEAAKERIDVISVSELIAETIRRLNNDESLSVLFEED